MFISTLLAMKCCDNKCESHPCVYSRVCFVCLFFALVHPDKAFKDDSTSTRTEQSRKKRDFSVCSCYVSDKLTKYPHHKNPPDENSYGLLGLKHYSYYITTLCYPDKLSVLLIVSFNVISLLFE